MKIWQSEQDPNNMGTEADYGNLSKLHHLLLFLSAGQDFANKFWRVVLTLWIGRIGRQNFRHIWEVWPWDAKITVLKQFCIKLHLEDCIIFQNLFQKLFDSKPQFSWMPKKKRSKILVRPLVSIENFSLS